jgi:hypothetical protein
MEFVGFPKISRYSRECIITEKIDGTNAQIYIEEMDLINPDLEGEEKLIVELYEAGKYFRVFAGSRSQWITPKNDNHGFARWVNDHADELLKLGPGRHFGEWWGQGIQRGYGLKEKRFSLFNIKKWSDPAVRPTCCHVVPVIYQGPFGDKAVLGSLELLCMGGSFAAPGFMKPEGIVIYHVPGNILFKKTIEKDEEYKGKK